MNAVPLRVLGARVLIEPDREDLSPQQTDSGLYTARSLGAAVSGSDEDTSSYSGTVVALGDALVTPFDVRPFVLRSLADLLEPDAPQSHRALRRDVQYLREAVANLPTERPCDVAIGDTVTFSHDAGQEIVIDGTPYLILDVDEILGVVAPQEELAHVG